MATSRVEAFAMGALSKLSGLGMALLADLNILPVALAPPCIEAYESLSTDAMIWLLEGCLPAYIYLPYLMVYGVLCENFDRPST